MKKSRKEIRRERNWKHFVNFLGDKVFDENLSEIVDYNPESWKDAFYRFQSKGSKSLTTEESRGIKPLIDAQKSKEITLNQVIESAFEFWAHGCGWMPILESAIKENKGDRVFQVAILRIIRNLRGGKLGEDYPSSVPKFFERYTGISDKTKNYLFAIKNQEYKEILDYIRKRKN